LFQAAKQSDDDPCQLELFGLAGSDRVITKDKQVTPLDGFVTDEMIELMSSLQGLINYNGKNYRLMQDGPCHFMHGSVQTTP
jgi:hypothetical protein